MSEVSSSRNVEILEMRDGKVQKVEIEGFDGAFVKSDAPSSARIFIDGKELSEKLSDFRTPKAAALFEDGAKVRLISGGGGYPLSGFEDGGIYEVESGGRSRGHWGEHCPDEVVRIVGGGVYQGFAKPEQLELVEAKPEEIEDTK